MLALSFVFCFLPQVPLEQCIDGYGPVTNTTRPKHIRSEICPPVSRPHAAQPRNNTFLKGVCESCEINKANGTVLPAAVGVLETGMKELKRARRL